MFDSSSLIEVAGTQGAGPGGGGVGGEGAGGGGIVMLDHSTPAWPHAWTAPLVGARQQRPTAACTNVSTGLPVLQKTLALLMG